MKDWEDNTMDEVMREHEEEAEMRALYPRTFAKIDRECMERQRRWHCGILFRWGSMWVGAHWAPHNKRLCINLVPFVTIWITAPGGVRP